MVMSLGATPSTEGLEFESRPWHKVVGKILAAPSVEYGNERAVWEK